MKLSEAIRKDNGLPQCTGQLFIIDHTLNDWSEADITNVEKVCSIGNALISKDISPKKYVETMVGDGFTKYINTVFDDNIPGEVVFESISLNDQGKSFAEVADYVESKGY